MLLPSFEEKLKNLPKDHLERIAKMIKKLRMHGKNALKILDVFSNYVLAEARAFKPPYRLYVVIDEMSNTFYVYEWSHKKKQKETIDRIKEDLKRALLEGFENVFGLS